MIDLVVPSIAGMVAGATIAGIGMVYSAAVGRGFWALPNNIAGIVLGPDAGNTRKFGLITLVGVGFHMVLSAIYGILTLVLANDFHTGLILTGLAVGMAVWGVNHYVLGAILPGARNHQQYNPLWMAFGLHALYGGITGAIIAQLIG